MAMRRGPHGLMGTKEKRSRPLRVLLGRMIGYLGRFKRIVAIGAVLSLVATIVSVFDPLVLQIGIDLVGDETSTLGLLLMLVGIYVLLKLIAWVLNGINTWILAGAQSGFVQNVQQDVYNHLVRADLSYHKSEQSGNVTSRVTSDAVSLGQGIQVIIGFASQVLMIVSAFLLLWFATPALALTSLVVVPGVAFIAALFGTVGQRIMLASQRAAGKVSGQIAENLSGIHIAKAFNREKELAKEMLDLNRESYKHGFRFMILMSAMQPLMRSIGQFATAAVLFVGGALAVGTLPLLTIGQVFLGVILVGRFMFPLLFVVMSFSQVQASMAAMDRVSDVLESKPSIADNELAISLAEESDGITFENVTFSYVKDTPVLNDVNFSIDPGEMVAVVGHTGAGKTTLAALVNRFYDPDTGRILIGTQDLRETTLNSLHENISLIPQEPYLFDDTILENIRYGKPEATEEEIVELCKIIGANEFIEVLADGYDTRIFESGKNLSAGQRQMITIARTMLANPKILILDEATSRLDAYSESLVQDAQEKLFADRTTIVIAHRLTTIANASRVLVFDHGKLIEQGSHEELLALNGTFKSLYDTYYAHQGFEELTEEVVETAKEVIQEDTEDAIPAGPGMMGMMGGMKSPGGMGGHGGMMGGMGGHGPPDPEKIKHMIKNMDPVQRKRMLEHKDMLPPPLIELLEKLEAGEDT
ncbi:MAG: ABC transporter ATP-binding protein [Candidatus Thorarchaeota archaeon]